MSEALTRIYAMQQRELNEQERQRQQQVAKRQRLINAFNASGLLDIFNEFRRLPTRPDVRRRCYKGTVNELTYSSDIDTGKLYSMTFAPINGMNSGPRWWCEENDMGNMRYGYSSGRSGDHGTLFDAPTGTWLDMFIEYMAAAVDPAAIANKMQIEAAHAPATLPRRQMQPV